MKRLGVVAASVVVLAGCGSTSKSSAPQHHGLHLSVACPHGTLRFTVPDDDSTISSTSVGYTRIGSDGLHLTTQQIGTARYEHGHVTARCAR
jgi:hypothetical protein